jgi:hypothetical protein
MIRRVTAIAPCLVVALSACDKPHTTVILDNAYAPSAANALVVYQAAWHAVSFPNPVPPGASSDPQSTVGASATTAYVLLAPGWDPASSAPPTSLIVLSSRTGFEVHLDETLHIPVDDTRFVGNCAAGSMLAQDQADYITQRIFPSVFGTVTYDAGSCKTTPIADAGGS